jgi:hypothetical protein
LYSIDRAPLDGESDRWALLRSHPMSDYVIPEPEPKEIDETLSM